ncbi:MAG: hypothetical protein P8R43_07970 [Planctomycetota bacterium]|nr:hypothetical protein [Planctomycetota bacterium]
MQETSHPPPESKHSILGCLLQALGAAAIVVTICAGALYLYFGVDARYEQREDIAPGRGRALIPPAATEITLDRHFPIDHEAWFTVEEKDLNAFFDEHYGRGGGLPWDLDSYSERRPVSRERFEGDYGFLDWVWHDEIVSYSYSAGNGGGQRYIHDPATGRTYHFSRYW